MKHSARDRRRLAASRHRTCGTCNACCFAFKLDGFEKPAGAWCPHCVVGSSLGCSIYSQRPSECVTFQCGWVLGVAGTLLTDAHRPDRSGVVVTAACLSQGKWRYLRYNLHETRSLAADTAVWRQFMVLVAEHTEAAVAVFPPGALGQPRSFYMPESHRRLGLSRPGMTPEEAAGAVHALQRVRFSALGMNFDAVVASAPLMIS